MPAAWHCAPPTCMVSFQINIYQKSCTHSTANAFIQTYTNKIQLSLSTVYYTYHDNSSLACSYIHFGPNPYSKTLRNITRWPCSSCAQRHHTCCTWPPSSELSRHLSAGWLFFCGLEFCRRYRIYPSYSCLPKVADLSRSLASLHLSYLMALPGQPKDCCGLTT